MYENICQFPKERISQWKGELKIKNGSIFIYLLLDTASVWSVCYNEYDFSLLLKWDDLGDKRWQDFKDNCLAVEQKNC